MQKLLVCILGVSISPNFFYHWDLNEQDHPFGPVRKGFKVRSWMLLIQLLTKQENSFHINYDLIKNTLKSFISIS